MSSNLEGFNGERCDRRRVLAATRFNADAVPLRFRGNSVAEANAGWTVTDSFGEIPSKPQDALALINAFLPPGSDTLAPEDVFIHIYEAANDNYVSDRSCFLAESTLRNVAADAVHGVSFMNSHRTGDISSPAEMPYGQSFAGQFQEGIDPDGKPSKRALVAVYMVKGIKPNGENGPSTDALHTMFQTGTIKDVSVGLRGGERLCDICGHPIGYSAEAYDSKTGRKLCRHAPGSTRNMNADQVAAQKQRDPRNGKGVASYTLHNARLGELSAVYDGAVPGAGIRQVLSLAKSGEMGKEDVRALLTEAFAYYREQFDFDLAEIVTLHDGPEPPKVKVPVPNSRKKVGLSMSKVPLLSAAIAAAIAPFVSGGGDDNGAEDAREDAQDKTPPAQTAPPVTPPTAPPSASSDLSAKERAELERYRANDSANQDAERLRRENAKTADFNSFTKEVAPKITPAQAPGVHSLYKALQRADDHNPVALERLAVNDDGTEKLGEDGKQVVERLSHTDLLREVFASFDKNFALGEVPSPEDDPEEAARYANSNPQKQPQGEDAAIIAAAKQEARDYAGATSKGAA